MPEDYLHYESLVEEALREVMRKALDIVAKEGLAGDHYFHITFSTEHPGVDIPAQLRREYPTEMPIVLQNAFWDLEVGELGFSVSLSFNRVQQRLTVPFDAITIFQDPPASFRLQFQAEEGDEADAADDEIIAADDAAEASGPTGEPGANADTDTAAPADDAAGPEDGDEDGTDRGGRGKVVTLDAFRNK